MVESMMSQIEKLRNVRQSKSDYHATQSPHRRSHPLCPLHHEAEWVSGSDMNLDTASRKAMLKIACGESHFSFVIFA
jgi:hypothetical protein